MATTYIPTGTNTRLGAKLRQANHELTNVRSTVRELKVVMETMITNGDYSMIETEFGLPAGTGETVYNLISGSLTDLDGANINQTIIRLG